MAGLTYPGIGFLRGYDSKPQDVLTSWLEGSERGKQQRFEEDAPAEFAKALPSLAEYGLATPPDELRAMFANPETRDLAIAQVKEATQRRADAMDPIKQLQRRKLEYDVAHQGDAPRNATLDSANARAKLGWEQGLRGEELKQFVLTGELAGAPGGGKYGMTPVYGVDEQGNPVIMQMGDTGQAVATALPEGVKALGPYDVNAQKAAGTAFGKQTGAAQFDVPGAALTMDQTIGALDDIRAQEKGMEEQFGNILGVPQQWTLAMPGSDKAKFQVAVDRATNLAFMQAREMLRGGGQITDFESRKAETAITNMQSAMEKGDQAQFVQAMNTFEQAVKDGYAKLQSQAGAMPSYGQQPAGGDDVDTILKGLGL